MEEKETVKDIKRLSLIKRFVNYYHPHKVVFIWDMVSSFFISAIALIYPIVTRKLLNTYIPDQNFKMIWICGVSLLGLYLMRMGFRYFVQYYGHVMGVKMQGAMRLDMFKHLQKLPYSYYDNHETGKIMSRMTNDLFQVSELAHHGPENIFISGFMLIITLVYLGTLNLYLTLILMGIIPIVLV
ncbi:MAG: ABC transporter transmembrane domain-containing protein, partial [Bacilli bacterium]